MVLEDEIRLGADAYLAKLLDRQTFVDRIWTAVKIAVIALSLFLSIFSLMLASRSNTIATEENLQLTDEVAEEEVYLEHHAQLISAINASIRDVMTEIQDILVEPVPIMFDCYRVHRLTRATVVTYDGCFIDTTKGGMDINTGIFTVQTEGIYTITFTAKYVSSNKGRFGAWSDLYVNTTVVGDSQREYNGNSDSKTESSTHTILVLYPLEVGHQVKVQFNKDGTSYIHSDDDHDVHFTVRRVSPLPSKTSTSTVSTTTTRRITTTGSGSRTPTTDQD